MPPLGLSLLASIVEASRLSERLFLSSLPRSLHVSLFSLSVSLPTLSLHFLPISSSLALLLCVFLLSAVQVEYVRNLIFWVYQPVSLPQWMCSSSFFCLSLPHLSISRSPPSHSGGSLPLSPPFVFLLFQTLHIHFKSRFVCVSCRLQMHVSYFIVAFFGLLLLSVVKMGVSILFIPSVRNQT